KHAVEQPRSGHLVLGKRQSGDHRLALRRRHKEEGQAVLVVKDSVAGANHGLGIGSVSQSHARLEVVVIAVDEEVESGLNVIAQAVVHRQLGREGELVLGKEAEVTVVQMNKKV